MIESNHFSNNSDTEAGATMIEFAAVIGVLMFLVLGIMDFSRYMTAKSLLRKSTQAAARYAATIEGMNVSLSNTGTLGTTERDEFFASYRAVEETAYRVSNTFASRSEVNGGPAQHEIRLLPYVLGTSPLDPGLPRLITPDIAIIMPGEEVQQADPSNGAPSSQYSQHDTLCPIAGCSNPCSQLNENIDCDVINFGDDYQDVLRNHPIAVEMRAEVDTFVPLLDTLEIVVRSYAYREIPARPSDLEPADMIPQNCTFECPPGQIQTSCGVCVVPDPPTPEDGGGDGSGGGDGNNGDDGTGNDQGGDGSGDDSSGDDGPPPPPPPRCDTPTNCGPRGVCGCNCCQASEN